MNCEIMQQKILLAESGEISLRDQQVLNSHLTQCPACRAYQSEISGLTAIAAEALQQDEPSGWVMTRIRATAKAKIDAPGRLFFMRPPVRLLAAAALVVIMFGGFWMLPERQTTDRVEEMNAIMAMVAADAVLQVELLEAADRAALADAESDSAEEAFSVLAEQLLIMEGFAVYGEEGEWTTLPEAQRPTALQLRSTPGALDRIYG